MVDGIPSNRIFKNKKELFEVAFDKNPAFAYAISPVDEGYNWFAAVYVVFKNCVVQVFADNLNDCHGIISTLYQNIAEELLTGPGAEGVFFNTDVKKTHTAICIYNVYTAGSNPVSRICVSSLVGKAIR